MVPVVPAPLLPMRRHRSLLRGRHMSVALTPEIHGAIVAGVRAGLSVARAGEIAGVPRTVLTGWLGVGTGGGAMGLACRRLQEDVAQAEAQSIADHLAIVTTAARTGTWQAAAWTLERRWPGEFGRRESEPVAADVRVRVEVQAHWRSSTEHPDG